MSKMTIHQDRSGLATMSILLVVLLVGVIGFAGWFVYQNNQSDDSSKQQATQTSEPADVTSVEIESSEDIDAAVTELEAIPVESDLDTTELDQDIQAVL